MGKYLIVKLLTTVMFFPAAGDFTQEKNSPGKKSITGRVPDGEYINTGELRNRTI